MIIDSYFARQPIFDRERRVQAYEILYRSSPTARTAEILDGVEATADVLAGAFGHAAPADLLAGLRGYVNVPRSMVVDRTLHAFAPDRLAIEVLEDVTADAEVLAALVDLRSAGFSIALDDFTPAPSRMRLLRHADVVKVDVRAVPHRELERIVALVSRYDVVMLAEKVESVDEFSRCVGLGFELFQGYFFARPEAMASHRLDAGRGRLVELLVELHSKDPDIDDVVGCVESHPELAFQILRVLNSSASGLPRAVESIREGVVLLGTRRLTELASLLVLAAHDHKPAELVTVALARARMCELIAIGLSSDDPSSYFTVGVFSVLDALADRPMEEVVEALPLGPEVRRALLDRRGPKGDVLAAVVAYEAGDWDRVSSLGVDASTLASLYVESLDWAGSMVAKVS